MTSQPNDRPDTQPGAQSAKEDWRDSTRFNKAEAIKGESPEGGEAMRRLMIAGGAMMATTLVTRLATSSPWLSFVLGLVVFGAVFYLTRPGRAKAAAKARARDQALDAAPDYVRDALFTAEEDLARIDAVAARLADRPGERGPALQQSLSAVTAAGRGVIEAVIADPNDYDRARKFFKALLPQARAAAEKFEAQPVADPALEARFRTLSDEVAVAFERQKDTLLRDERIDLEVEMEVLADRVRAETGGAAR